MVDKFVIVKEGKILRKLKNGKFEKFVKTTKPVKAKVMDVSRFNTYTIDIWGTIYQCNSTDLEGVD